MKYLEHVNGTLRKHVSSTDGLVAFGQNVAAGSRISGFTKGFAANPKGKIINTTTTENAMVGFGLGVMLGGGKAAFFVKQLDFLFLGIDQMVDTYNIIRNYGHAKGSFTILPIVVDMGYQGPQSSSNNFADFCSIARIPGYALTNKYDVEKILELHFDEPGFRIISISQRMFKEEAIDTGAPIAADKDMQWAQYKSGKDATIITFNFSFPYGWQIGLEMEKAGLSPSIFNVNYMTPIDWAPIVADVRKTGKLIVARVLSGEEAELIAMSKKGQVIRTALKDIPTLGRQTQGVTIMRLRDGDGIASLACL